VRLPRVHDHVEVLLGVIGFFLVVIVVAGGLKLASSGEPVVNQRDVAAARCKSVCGDAGVARYADDEWGNLVACECRGAR